jgi:hypothetical protein
MNRVSPALSINQLHPKKLHAQKSRDFALKRDFADRAQFADSGSLYPKRPIEGPILNRFAHVFGVDLVARLQIGDRA